jgi:hypothetical protein
MDPQHCLKGSSRAFNRKKPVSARNNRFLDPDTTGQDALSWIGSIMLTLDQDLDEKTRFKKKVKFEQLYP